MPEWNSGRKTYQSLYINSAQIETYSPLTLLGSANKKLIIVGGSKQAETLNWFAKVMGKSFKWLKSLTVQLLITSHMPRTNRGQYFNHFQCVFFFFLATCFKWTGVNVSPTTPTPPRPLEYWHPSLNHVIRAGRFLSVSDTSIACWFPIAFNQQWQQFRSIFQHLL